MSSVDERPTPLASPPDKEGRSNDLGFEVPPPASLSRLQVTVVGLGFAAVVGAAFAWGYWPRRAARAALEDRAKIVAGASARVDAVTPAAVSTDRALVLPASVQPLEETVVFARANGYVKKWLVDIGDKVTEGQLLAEIDAPDLDREIEQGRAQLAQAQASLAQARATHDLAATNLARSEKLAAAGVSSQQDLDQKRGEAKVDDANVLVAQAAVATAEANIHKLDELKAFSKVAAPFAGTVTARTVQRGQLVTAGNANPLFRIASLDPVRVLVGIPQDVAPSVKPDMAATVTVREFAGRKFEGKVARVAGALDSASRTMNVEVRVPNPDQKLLSGMYAQVSIDLPTPHRVFELPATALYNDAKGLRVATVTADDKVHFVTVVVERDTGSTVQISTGLEGTERVVKLANASLVEGQAVTVGH